MDFFKQFDPKFFNLFHLGDIDPSWIPFFRDNMDELKKIDNILHGLESIGCTIYPSKQNVFRIFKLCPLEKIKVVILGQDPYHGENQANGIAFAVNKDIAVPPSLRNIMEKSGCVDKTLVSWVRRGIFMLNTSLTVTKNTPNSHSKIWKKFSECLIRYISNNLDPITFHLWGIPAQSNIKYIDAEKHEIIRTTHPSPLAARKHGTKAGVSFMESGQFEKKIFLLVKQNETQ